MRFGLIPLVRNDHHYLHYLIKFETPGGEVGAKFVTEYIYGLKLEVSGEGEGA